MIRKPDDFVPRLLGLLGIKATKLGGKWIAVCPNPEHMDRKPSWGIIDRGGAHEKTGSHHCFACGFNGGPWELVAAVKGWELEEAGRWVTAELLGRREAQEEDVPIVRISQPKRAELGGIELPFGTQIPSLDGSEWNPTALEYLHDRNVPDWQIERWGIGFATRGRLAWRIVVPVWTKGRLLAYVARAFLNDGRPRYDVSRGSRNGRKGDPGARPEAAVFGEPAFPAELYEPKEGRSSPIVGTVTEGVFKSLAMERAGAPNPMAILGSQNLGPEKVALLARFDLLLIATDPDPAGNKAARVIEESVARYVETRRVPLTIAPDDASEEQNRRALELASRRRRVWRTDRSSSDVS